MLTSLLKKAQNYSWNILKSYWNSSGDAANQVKGGHFHEINYQSNVSQIIMIIILIF